GGETIPGTYKVGGRRVPGPTSPDRDSSLGINKAPGNMNSCREAQTVACNIGRPARFSQMVSARVASFPAGSCSCASGAASIGSGGRKGAWHAFRRHGGLCRRQGSDGGGK